MDLLNCLDVGVVVLRSDNQPLSINPAAHALLGAWVPSPSPSIQEAGAGVERRRLAERWLELRWRRTPEAQWVVAVLDVSDTVRAQREAIRGRGFIAELGNISAVGLWSLEMRDRSLHWSAVVCLIHGVPEGYQPTLEEAIQFYAPEARPVILSAVTRGIQNGTPWDLELPFITRQGRRIWVRAMGRAIHQDGECVRLLGAFQDITERKNAEVQLRRALAHARQYETLFESADALVAIANHEGRFVQLNATWKRLLGRPLDEISSQPLLSLVHPDDLPTTIQGFARLQTPPYETVSFQNRVRSAQGDWVWLSWCCATDPVTGYIYAVVHDITEMRQVQEQLRRLAMIAQHTRNAVLITDTNGRIEWVNPAFVDISGYTLEEVQGKTPGQILQGAETNRETVRFMRTRIRAGEGFRTEIINYKKSGAPYWLELEVQPMRDGDGTLVGFMGIETDITARKQSETELIAARNRAEALAAAAERANRAKSNFLAIMSHELRTPMNGVLGMVQLLEQTTLDSLQRSYVEGIHGSSVSLLSILNDILDFSKIEAGRLEINPEPFALIPLLTEVQRLLRASVAGRGLKLRLTVDPALPTHFVGDPLRVRQVVLNLVGNAVKFTEQGAVDIRARWGEGGRLRVEVQDTGVGISPEAQARLFLPFSQVDISATRRFSGTGLGLAICHQLVAMMSGTIHVESTLGQGSCFWFEIPLPIHATAVVDPSPPTEVVEGDAVVGRTVLLVEDHRVNQMVAVHMLKRLGCIPTVATDGIEALSALRARTFDLVLMDCHMPNLDGWEATRRYRAMEEAEGRARTPIIALTANAMSEDREACLTAGMDDYLSKPLQQEVLLRVLARWSRPTAPVAFPPAPAAR